MPNLNTVVIAGHLTRTPEIKYAIQKLKWTDEELKEIEVPIDYNEEEPDPILEEARHNIYK